MEARGKGAYDESEMNPADEAGYCEYIHVKFKGDFFPSTMRHSKGKKGFILRVRADFENIRQEFFWSLFGNQ